MDTPVKKAKLHASAPVLLVKDVVASARYYRDQLGFEHQHFWGEPPNFAIIRRDQLSLMLAKAETGKIVPHWRIVEKTCNVYFWVDDALALHQEFVGRGVNIDYGPCVQPYQVREFGIQDPNGYDIAFGQDLATHPDP